MNVKTNGKYAKRRGGHTVILREDESSSWPFVGDDGLCYSRTGCSCVGDDDDLVGEITPEVQAAMYEMEMAMMDASAGIRYADWIAQGWMNSRA